MVICGTTDRPCVECEGGGGGGSLISRRDGRKLSDRNSIDKSGISDTLCGERENNENKLQIIKNNVYN